MVNKNLSTKAQFLRELRENQGRALSGEIIATRLGISRVAVWKSALSLREAGYAVQSQERGYLLLDSREDFVYPWEFGEYEGQVRHWKVTSSTMDRAREIAEKGRESGLAVLAEEQSAGRGRGGRDWESARGGLFCTLLRREELPTLRAFRPTMALQLAASRALSPILGAQVRPVWPNDLEIRGKKIGGILSECRSSADRIVWINLGIGINVNNRPSLSEAISCQEILGKAVSRREILTAIFRELDRSDAPNAASTDLVSAWNAQAGGIGAPVGILSWNHGKKKEAVPLGSGVFRGIDDYGRALIERGRQTETVDPGSASLAFY